VAAYEEAKKQAQAEHNTQRVEEIGPALKPELLGWPREVPGNLLSRGYPVAFTREDKSREVPKLHLRKERAYFGGSGVIGTRFLREDFSLSRTRATNTGYVVELR
jgi:hypothetical protein